MNSVQFNFRKVVHFKAKEALIRKTIFYRILLFVVKFSRKHFVIFQDYVPSWCNFLTSPDNFDLIVIAFFKKNRNIFFDLFSFLYSQGALQQFF